MENQREVDVIDKLTFVEMWTKLRELFDPQDGTTKIHTLATLFHMSIL